MLILGSPRNKDKFYFSGSIHVYHVLSKAGIQPMFEDDKPVRYFYEKDIYNDMRANLNAVDRIYCDIALKRGLRHWKK